MKSKRNHLIIVIALMSAFGTGRAQEEKASDTKLYQEARKKCFAQAWNEAIDLFQQIIDEHADSQYTDDASFWIGYCMENKSGSEVEAFVAFDNFVNDFANSPWVDDAIVHQISLAEKLTRQGKNQFMDFIVQQLEHEEPAVCQQAALALGRLGDSRALPFLDAMKTHEDLGPIAKSLIQKIQSGKTEAPKFAGERDTSRQLKIDVEGEKKTGETTKSEATKTPFFHFTRRHRQYTDMLKGKEDWTHEELFDFGMWQILPTDAFTEYVSLKGYDRSEWLRKYWKQRDPTPTTETNEGLIEFEERIKYARAHFSELWNYRHFRYLKDQHRREGWLRAPWDARGEIYIKYGEPDAISPVDNKQDEWIYYGYGVDFIIDKYKTNIYADAIRPGEMTSKTLTIEHVNANFIFKQEFRYEHDYKMKPLKKAECSVETNTHPAEANVHIHYSAPKKEFKPVKKDNANVIEYLERIVIFDEDMREVLRHETTKTIPYADMNETINLSIQPGRYIAALRIEDQHSNKLAIFKEPFVVTKSQ